MVWLAVIFIGPPIPSALGATLTVPTLIGNHMVLQGGMSVPIWGTAAPGAQVTVEFNGQDVSTTAAANGRWLRPPYNFMGSRPTDVTGVSCSILSTVHLGLSDASTQLFTGSPTIWGAPRSVTTIAVLLGMFPHLP
jgi:hypothetical protein